MRFLGVDPGVHGAVAALDDQGRVLELARVPVVPGSAPAEYDLARCRTLLWRLMAWRPANVHVTIERLDALPAMRARRVGEEPEHMGGFKTNHRRGETRGWAWMLVGMGVPVESILFVLPKQWQKVQFAGERGDDTKELSIKYARRLWPGVPLILPHGRTESADAADALHLAQFGRMVRKGGHIGGPLFAAPDSREGRPAPDIFRAAR